MKNCESCKHFYECDNMRYYENCLPDMKDYEERGTLLIGSKVTQEDLLVQIIGTIVKVANE